MTESTPDAASTLRDRLHRGQPLIGSFVKTPSHAIVELLGLAGLDFIVIDAEHAPIDLHALDPMLMAARAGRLPALVRVPRNEPTVVNACLDAGADGVLVPHIRSATEATAAHAACRYAQGLRGFSPSPRAGGYGTVPAATVLREADTRVGCWCQIEDAQAIERIDAIAAVPGLDCLFVGRQDLALSLGVDSVAHTQVQQAVERVAAAGRANSVPLGIFVSDVGEIPPWRAMGFTAFVCGSDQSLLLSGARAVMRSARASERPER